MRTIRVRNECVGDRDYYCKIIGRPGVLQGKLSTGPTASTLIMLLDGVQRHTIYSSYLSRNHKGTWIGGKVITDFGVQGGQALSFAPEGVKGLVFANAMLSLPLKWMPLSMSQGME